MKSKIYIPGLVAALLVFNSVLAEAAVPPWLAADPDHESLQAGMVAALAPLYYGDRAAALEAADDFLAQHPDHPLPLLVKARIMREGIIEQDWNTDPIKIECEPIHLVLDQAVALCDAAKEAGTAQPVDNFYKGWALMFKSQLYAFATSNYTAGKAASRGYDRLEDYLEVEPYDPDARGFLGIYQFFADTLPGIAKFVSKLLSIPGGNETKGLANMRFACAKAGPLQTDHEVVQASTYVFFAGQLEDALVQYGEITQKYPAYVRMAEPLAISALFYPAELHRLVELQQGLVLQHVQILEESSDWTTLRRLTFYNSLAALLYQSPAAAAEGFTQLIDKGAMRPDWMIPFAQQHLACLLAGMGRHDEARAIFTELSAHPEQENIRKTATACLEDESSWQNQDLTANLDFIAAIHDGRLQKAREGLDLYGLRRGENLIYCFYSGELDLAEGDLDQALIHFKMVREMDAPLIYQVFRMFAAARLAEIHGSMGDFDAAKSLLGKALDSRLNEPTVRLLLKGRERFYQNLKEGDQETDPSLVIAIHY